MEAVESFLARIPEEMDPPDEPDIEPFPGLRSTPNDPYRVNAWLAGCMSRERQRETPEAVRLMEDPRRMDRIHHLADVEWRNRPPKTRREWINRTYKSVATTYGLSGFTEALLWLMIRLVIRYLWALYNRKPACAPRLII